MGLSKAMACSQLYLNGVAEWSLGTAAYLVLGSDNKYYLANPTGDPAHHDPVASGSVPTHWYGGFTTMGGLLAFMAQNPSCCSQGVKRWVVGDSGANGNGIVLGSDGKWYLANPNGDPAHHDPVAPVYGSNQVKHWLGPYSSLADLLADYIGTGKPAATISHMDCATGTFILTDANGNSCNLLDAISQVLCNANPFKDGQTYQLWSGEAGSVTLGRLRGDGLLVFTVSDEHHTEAPTFKIWTSIFNGIPTTAVSGDDSIVWGPVVTSAYRGGFNFEYMCSYLDVSRTYANNMKILNVEYTCISSSNMCDIAPTTLNDYQVSATTPFVDNYEPPYIPDTSPHVLWSGAINGGYPGGTLPFSDDITKYSRITFNPSSGEPLNQNGGSGGVMDGTGANGKIAIGQVATSYKPSIDEGGRITIVDARTFFFEWYGSGGRGDNMFTEVIGYIDV